MIEIAFPFQIAAEGRTASVDYPTHVRDLIEQVLFTQPGERVNRPAFGSGLMQAMFAPNGIETAATRFLAQTALQQWLGDLIDVVGVEVTAVDATLSVTVQYVIKQTATAQTAQYTRTV